MRTHPHLSVPDRKTVLNALSVALVVALAFFVSAAVHSWHARTHRLGADGLPPCLARVEPNDEPK